VILFPNCKINLGLYITGKRPDGYHNLQTCFYPVALHDVLEIVETPDAQTTLFASGMESGSGADNSCMKAYRLLKKAFPHLPEVAIHLHKAIPVGGGLGGGSADAAFTLVLLNRKFQLNLTEDALLETMPWSWAAIAPFLLKIRPASLPVVAKNCSHFHSIYPVIRLCLSIRAFTSTPAGPLRKSHRSHRLLPFLHFCNSRLPNGSTPGNVFEPALFRQHPAIKEVKDVLYQTGAVYASLSGSGATVYGIFEKEHPIRFSFPTHYLVKEC
jgi:4-diphosphocytidyl-2-C-methyl-D-erythritol kinase